MAAGMGFLLWATSLEAAFVNTQAPADGLSLSPVELLSRASHTEKPAAALKYIEQARQQIAQGTDPNAADSHGRTALHWATLGAMYVQSEKLQKAYVELAEQLIYHGADLNREDEFGNTPLDYQTFSPNERFGLVFLENSARRGSRWDEKAGTDSLLNQLSEAAQREDLDKVCTLLAPDLPEGTELQIRLTAPLASNRSRAGDTLAAVLIAPVQKGGRLVVPAGCRLAGTVLYAAKAAHSYEQAVLILDFAQLIFPDGAVANLTAAVKTVDNARETVRDGKIVGVSNPRNPLGKLSWGTMMLGKANPILAVALETATFGFRRTYHREIIYPAGVEMTLQLLSPLRLPPEEGQLAESPVKSAPAPLVQLVNSLPYRAETARKIPSDLTNVMLVGSRDKIEAAFEAASWEKSVKAGIRSDIKIFVALAESKGYQEGPISALFIDGQAPDLVYQKQNNTFTRRHHIRIWKCPESFEGQEVWIAAATHDVGIAVHRHRPHWVHRIDPRIDLEREKVADDLSFTRMVKSTILVPRPGIPNAGQNGVGDSLVTDGQMLVVRLE